MLQKFINSFKQISTKKTFREKTFKKRKHRQDKLLRLKHFKNEMKCKIK